MIDDELRESRNMVEALERELVEEIRSRYAEVGEVIDVVVERVDEVGNRVREWLERVYNQTNK